MSLTDETLIPLPEAADHFPSNPPHSTLWRWTRNGVRGVKLESIRQGNRIFTSIEAIERFNAATNEGDE